MRKEKQSKRHQATEIIQLFREGRSDEALVLFEKYGFRKEFICFAVTRGIDYEDASDLVQKFIIDKNIPSTVPSSFTKIQNTATAGISKLLKLI